MTYILFIFLVNVSILAQAPYSFNFQSIAKDSKGEIISNQRVSFRITILEGSETGTAVYSEIHSITSNQFGLANLSIGEGETSDLFSAIDWGVSTYYIKVELDINGGSDYQEVGVSQLRSVPYAIYANNSVEAVSVAGIYNIMNYGASNTGADSETTTKAINDAVADLQLQTGNKGVIYFPPGRYLINDQIDIDLSDTREGITIKGDGPGVTVLAFESSASNGFHITFPPAGGYDGNTGSIIIKDFSIETMNAGVGDAIHLVSSGTTSPAPHKLIENVTITGSSTSNYWKNGIRLTNCTFTNIRGVQFQGKSNSADWEGVAVLMEGMENPVDNFITNLRVWNADKAVEITGHCEGVTIDQSIFLAINKGIHWHTDTDGHEPWLGINNCHISASEACVFAEQLMQCQINNNLFYCQAKTDVDWAGIWFSSLSPTDYDFLQITHNTIHGFENGSGLRNGILLNNVKNSLISGNIIYNVITGVNLNTVSNSKVLDNMVFGSTNGVVETNCTGNTIR